MLFKRETSSDFVGLQTVRPRRRDFFISTTLTFQKSSLKGKIYIEVQRDIISFDIISLGFGRRFEDQQN